MERIITEPRQIGEILRELFIILDDGTVDLDLVVAYAQAAAIHDNTREEEQPC